MELAPVPRRPRLATRGRTLLAVAVFLPITLFALVPAALGLQRYVVADDVGRGIHRGSLVIERRVPSSDLRVDDVITFRPATDRPLITRRILSIELPMTTTSRPTSPTWARCAASWPIAGAEMASCLASSLRS